jgi:hypothetical protein
MKVISENLLCISETILANFGGGRSFRTKKGRARVLPQEQVIVGDRESDSDANLI